jgi:hypothetical protein
MIVRIRLGYGDSLKRARRRSREIAQSMASVLIPVCLMASVLSAWRLASDLSLAADFAIREGPLSHWQAWAAIATLLGLAAGFLNRYGCGSRFDAPPRRQSSPAGGDIP